MRNALLIALGLCFVGSGPVFAFHDGGVAACNGCHTMHNMQDGVLVDPDSPNGNPWLLKDASPSDVCLDCHSDHLGAVFSVNPLAPDAEFGGGNFVFLLEDNLNDGHNGANEPISGDAAGHNIIAPSRGVGADATLTLSPGGAFPASVLGCTSCHDPHGNTNFRLLYGPGPVQDETFTFTRPAPDAAGLAIFFGQETDSTHTAYKGGMSNWCGNCHGSFHQAPTGIRKHPSGEGLTDGIIQTYNLYNGTVDQVGGSAASAYLAAVPFEDPAATTTSKAGPTGDSEVSCISCHRAHATSAPDAGRWDFNVTFLHEDGLESGSYAIPDPYNNNNQRSLCNKCHNKDEGDENPF